MTKETPRQLPTPNEVVSALNRTGFILEYRVAQKLRATGFYTEINSSYPDPKTDKSREIDVFASIDRLIKPEPTRLKLYVEMVIECKNSPNPLVLIGERGHDTVVLDESVILSFDPLRLNFPKKRRKLAYFELNLSRLPGFRTTEDFMGHQLVRMDRPGRDWKANNNSVYDSIVFPLAKAWQYQIQMNKDDEDEVKRTPPWLYPNLMYILPVIVTAGPVFTVDVTNEEIKVEEVGWASLKRSFTSEEIWLKLRADVVSFQHFDDYLKARPITIFNNAENALKSNIHLFDPEWLLANMGVPQKKEIFTAWLNHVRSYRDSQ